MKNVMEMTTEELNAEYKGLQKVAQDIINPTSGCINPDGFTGDLQRYQAEVDQRIDLIVQEIADRAKKKYVAVLCSIQRRVPSHSDHCQAFAALIKNIIANDYELALQMKDILDEQIQAKDDALGEDEDRI